MSDFSPGQRIDGIVAVLERLGHDVEIIREGADTLRDTLPSEFTAQITLLLHQSEALDRISIALGMVQHAVANLRDPVGRG